ncbi:MAG TPA: S9 family peptidase [Acidimicrobiales bacterium]|nr:S9 family peptidase [Acidimicrobiales bacterium]
MNPETSRWRLPPRPVRRPTVLTAHGDRRVDDWYWLRDRDDPVVIAHLRAENAYAEEVLRPLEGLTKTLFDEIVARIQETDLSVPVRHGPFWYYIRTEEAKSYPLHCRRPADGDDPPSGPAGPGEESILLDENRLAQGHEYFDVGNLAVSPDHDRLAFAVDTTGGERFELSFRELGDVPPATETLPDTFYGLAWASDSETIFYTRVDEAMRPYQLWRHRLGTDPGDDVLVLEEPDQRFTLSVGRTKSEAFVLVTLASFTMSEVWAIPADRPEAEAVVVAPREAGVEYALDHYPGAAGDPGWWLAVTNHGARDFRLLTAPDDVAAPGRFGGGGWRELLPHRPGTRLEGIDVLTGWLVAAERLEGEHRLRLLPVPGPGGPTGPLLEESWLLPAEEHPATTTLGPNPDFTSGWLRYEESSLVTPRSVYDLELATHQPVLRKRQPVLGGYDPARYRTTRLWAPTDDGRQVPISLVHHVDLLDDPVAPDGTPPAVPAPCLLYGYGAYEASIDPVFSSLRLSLLERGFVFAIAHVRGGGELGRRWYEEGKLVHKPHTFTDFVACAEHLVDEGFTAPDRLVGRGASAGGLLIGAVANLAPHLFRAFVAEVPFVDCLTTMLDETLPLTVGEWEEWGDPVTDPHLYEVIKSYSPYDNVASTEEDGGALVYPPILVTAGLHDAMVGYWEPAKWVAKLRAANPENRVLLRTELGAGHGGLSGRYDAWREEAVTLAFVLDAVGRAARGRPDAGRND